MRMFVTTKFALNKILAFLSVMLVSGLAVASTPCTQEGFQEILDGMIDTGGQYLEVFPANASQFPIAFTQAEQMLSSDSEQFKGAYVVRACEIITET
jgi:hypothetical protein